MATAKREAQTTARLTPVQLFFRRLRASSCAVFFDLSAHTLALLHRNITFF
jgi:hypothetical protein